MTVLNENILFNWSSFWNSVVIIDSNTKYDEIIIDEILLIKQSKLFMLFFWVWSKLLMLVIFKLNNLNNA